MDFGRVITAMVTPFNDDGSVDYTRVEALVERLIATGSGALVVAGTTGESPTLSDDEKLQLFRVVAKAVNKRVKVIAGTGSNETAHTVNLTREAEKTGVDGVMVVVPYYNKPSQEGIYQHFKAAAAATSLPLIVYNVPTRTITNITPETVLRLAQIDNIVAVKEASGNLEQVGEIIRKKPQGFTVYSGDDSLTLPILSIGGHGVISVASHIVGDRMQEMIKAYLDRDTQKAMEIHLELLPIFKGLFLAPSPAPVKAALKLTGFDAGVLRLPLVDLNEKEFAAVKQLLVDQGLV